MAVDISTELTQIADSSSGPVVKDAIYSALLKISLAEGGGGGGTIVGPAWRVLHGFKTCMHGCIQTEEE